MTAAKVAEARVEIIADGVTINISGKQLRKWKRYAITSLTLLAGHIGHIYWRIYQLNAELEACKALQQQQQQHNVAERIQK